MSVTAKDIAKSRRELKGGRDTCTSIKLKIPKQVQKDKEKFIHNPTYDS